MNRRLLRPAAHDEAPEWLPRAEECLPAPREAQRRLPVERALDHALRTDATALVLLRAPRGAGRRTAVALWARRLVREGTVVVWVDVPESDAVDGDALGQAVRTRLAHVIGEAPPAPEAAGNATAAATRGTAPEDLAAALDVRRVVLVVDRIGPRSDAALAYLDQVARVLRRSRIVALTAIPLPGPVPTFDAWAPDAGSATPTAREPARHAELTLRDLAVRPDEAQAAAASLGVPLTRPQASLLVTAAAGWAAVVHPALAELRRASAAGVPVTDDVVSTAAAAQRAAFLRAAVPEEAISVLVEVSLAPQLSRAELAATGLLAALPGADVFIDRLVDTGLLLADPAGPDDILTIEPNARRALLDYARGRDRDELHRRAAKAARRQEQLGDARGALLVALESGDAGLVRDLLHGTWTGILDGHDPTLHEALWSAAAAAPVTHVPAELRALLSATRRSPGRPGMHELPAAPAGPHRPTGPEGSLQTFARIVRLRRAGRTEDALRRAAELLGATGGTNTATLGTTSSTFSSTSDVARVLVGLQAGVTATEAGMLDEALRYAEGAHQSALGSGALPLAAAAAELAALVHALDSAVHAAADWSAEAAGLPEPPAWWRRAVGDPAALVSALARLDRLDDDLPDHLLGAVQDAARTDLWFAGLHVEATLAALRGHEEPAVDRLREALAQRGRTPTDTEPSADHLRIPPLLALDLGRLYLALGRGTNAVVVADALTSRAPAVALLDGRLRLAQGRPRDALLAVTAVGHQGSTAGARLVAHLMAAEALTTIDGAGTGRTGDQDGDGTAAGGSRADVRRQLAQASALAQRVGGALPYWSASSDVLRLAARDATAHVREQIAEVLRRRADAVPAEFVVVPDRQLVVLHHLADGLTSTEVAKASFVSHNTVKTQIREVYRRLGVHDRTAALQRARELGLLDPMVRARLSPSRP
ncbi:helix-turn-helix transcriptional regulator [Promicromonospora panici]|uniref:helix-turn-helix transcriptional regulator n=1 Tax=Promicromonospora panici TaxID=2219658 RepID=UPI00101C9A0C|nr:LuxR C-terminal-related transcriptional regulator [Promicromonospora panici]